MACKLGAHIASGPLTDADRELLANWSQTGKDSRGRDVSGEAMAMAINAGSSVPVGPTTVKDHRAGRCACHRGKATP